MNRNNEATSRVINAPNHAADLSNYESCHSVNGNHDYRESLSMSHKNRNKVLFSTNHIKDESKTIIRNNPEKISRNNPHEKICFFYIIKITLMCRMVNNAILIFLIIYSLHAEVTINFNFKIA